MQQFGLNGQIKAADLVQKERTVVGLLDPAELGRHGACKGPFFITKQLGFEQRVGDGWTAYLHQRATGPHGEGVQQAHTNLFAGAALTLDEDGDIGLRNPLQLVPDRLHCGSFSENDIQRREVERGSGFGVVDQGHFFLSAFRQKPAKFAICFTLHVEHQS